jgi:hypothetical protein
VKLSAVRAREIGDPIELVLSTGALGLIKPPAEIPAWLKESFRSANRHKAWPPYLINRLAHSRRLNAQHE